MRKYFSSQFFICTMFLTIAITVLLSPKVYAAEIVASGYCGGEDGGTNLSWAVTDDGLLTISGTGAMTVYSPDDVQPWYAFKNQLHAVEIESGVTSIGSYAFCNCDKVTTITIPDGVTKIGTMAFSGCSGFTSIVVPDSVTSIGAGAFNGCSALNEITLPFIGGTIKNSSSSYQYPFGYIFGEASYTGGTATKQTFYEFPPNSRKSATYYIPNSLRTVTITGGNILDGAFYGCSSLTSITLPDELVAIEGHAFYNCTGLTEFSFPASVKSIGEYAFAGCTGFTSFTVPDTVTWLGEGVFNACTSLTEITLPFVGESIKKSSDTYQYPFGYIFSTPSFSEGTYIEQPFHGYSLTDKSYFRCCIPDCLESVTITGGYILGYAFYNCSKITEITLPDGIHTIGEYAFYGCSKITDIALPDAIDTIGEYAFYGCAGLTSFLFTNRIKTIGQSAFANCYALEEIGFAGDAPTIGSKAFSRVTATAHYLPDNSTWTDSVKQDYGGTITWMPHLTCIDADGVPYFEEIDEGIEPTCNTSGLSEGSHCKLCDKVIIEQQEILGKHNYGNAVFNWDLGYSTVTATVTCSNCTKDTTGHTYTVPCHISSKWDEKNGILRFVASAEINGKTFTDESQYIKIAIENSKLIVSMSLVETSTHTLIMLAEYDENGQMRRCQMDDGITGACEFNIMSSGVVKVFFLQSDSYIPISACAELNI